VQGQLTTHNSQPADLPRFVVTLPANPKEAGLIRIPLAITGTWVRGTTVFSITRDDLESIVRNFRARQNGEINVDYDHASEMPEVAAGGPVPSAGRIVRLDAPETQRGPGFEVRGSDTANPDSRFILYGWFEPTARARRLIENREYRFISPAIEWGAKSKRTGKPQGTTLTSVALTNRPFLEEMPPIRLSDPEFLPVTETGNRHSRIAHRKSAVSDPAAAGAAPRFIGTPAGLKAAATPALQSPVPIPGFGVSPSAGATSAREGRALPAENGGKPPHSKGGAMKHVTLSVEDGRIHISHEELPGGFYFDPADLEAVGARHALPLQEGPAAFSESAVVTFAQARALLSEAEAKGKFIPAAEVFRAAAEQELEDAVRAGKVLPRQRDDWRKIALSDLPTFRRLMSAQKPVVPLAPVGLAGTPPADVQEQIKFMAEQRVRERQISFGQALADIGREQPDLIQQYRRAVSSHE
jgi:hypothetical protein